MTYKSPRPLHVKWNRLVNSLILISAVLSARVELLYFFLLLNIVTFGVTIHYGPSRWLLQPFEKMAAKWLDVSPAYARSYAMNLSTERFEIISRLLTVSMALLLYPCCPMAVWLITVGMGIFMLISTFFGFCISALGFLAMNYIMGRCRVR